MLRVFDSVSTNTAFKIQPKMGGQKKVAPP